MARPPLRLRNPNLPATGKSSGYKATNTVDIDSPIIPGRALALRKKYDKETTALRNVAIKIVSDFISEELVGFGKKLTKQQEAFFATPKAAPDGVVDVNEFERTTGQRISQTNVLKGTAARNVGFFEAKIKGLGQTAEPEITSVSVGRASGQFGEVTSALRQSGTTGLTGAAAVKLLFSPSLTAQREALIIQTKQKFENFLLIQVTDADKKPTQELLFSPTPLANVRFNEQYLNQNFDIRFRSAYFGSKSPKAGEIQRYRISITPKPALFNSFKLEPITKKVFETQKRAGFKVSSEFDKYIRKRGAELSAKGTSKDKVDRILGFLIAFAEEFKEGGLTPLTIKTKIQQPKVSKIPGFNIAVKGNQRQKTQKFISGAQISALVRKRLGDKMPKGPRRGPPLAADILTERSGRFRSSVQVIPDYRRSVMAFFYDPIYRVFNNTPRDPDRFVGETVREVVQGLYSRAFYITRT